MNLFADPRRSDFLSRFEPVQKSIVASTFYQAIRDAPFDQRDSALIVHAAWLRLQHAAEKEADAGKEHHGFATFARYAAVYRDVPEVVHAFAEWAMVYEALTPEEKATLKAPRKALYKEKWERFGPPVGEKH